MASTYKVLGQLAPNATTDTTLYTVPVSTQAVISTIIVANRAATAGTFQIAIRPAGATLANQHFIAFNVQIAANDSTTLTLGITLGPTDVITVNCSSANMSVNVFGSEIS